MSKQHHSNLCKEVKRSVLRKNYIQQSHIQNKVPAYNGCVVLTHHGVKPLLSPVAHCGIQQDVAENNVLEELQELLDNVGVLHILLFGRV
jgi:hypothetical protein